MSNSTINSFSFNTFLCCDVKEKKFFCTLTNSRMEPVHVKEALSLLDIFYLFTIQNERHGSLQHAIEGIIKMVET